MNLKSHYVDFITSGAQLPLLVVVWQFDEPHIRATILSSMAVLGLFAWASALRRYRAIHDTPTARISSAPQGYVELQGRAQLPKGFPAVGLRPAGGTGYVWFRYRIEERDAQGDWRTRESGRSEQSFWLEDDSGRCLVDPDHAEIMARHKQVWTEHGRRYTEWYIMPGDMLYAIGEFASIGAGHLAFNDDAELSAILEDWKKDQPRLLQRFDSNGDGQIDMAEWELARAAARQEMQQRQHEQRLQPGMHIMHKPRDGRFYLISNQSPQQLANAYRWWSLLHLLVFLGAGAVATMMVLKMAG